MSVYAPSVAAQMRSFYQSLSEKDRRRYAAVEAAKLGRGGITYMAEMLGCKRHTITQGLRESGDPTALAQPRIRRQGGGRKPSEETIPGLADAFLRELYRAGTVYCRTPIETLDHDYPSLAEGVVIPHGIYDMTVLPLEQPSHSNTCTIMRR